MDKQTFKKKVLDRLENEDISALKEFEKFQKSKMDLYEKIARTHEFLDLLAFKLKQSKCTLDKSILSGFLLDIYKKTIRKYDYNQKFIASQFKTLIIYHKNCKDFNKAIEALEFLIQLGITDDDSQGFHIQLDELYRLRKKRMSKQQSLPKQGAGI